jgi:hypothetical protein
LFDDTYGEGEEGLYDDLKNTLLEDPDGPQIDVDKEIFGRLSPQVTLLARDALPVTPDSPQRLLALSTMDEAALKAVVKKVLESDPNSEANSVAGHDAFFSYVEEEDGFGGESAAEDADKSPSFITCVANGHLMFATDVKILEDALSQGDSLIDHSDYKNVISHLKGLGEETCIQYFGRLQNALRVNYELLRLGKKPNSAKSFRGLLNNIAAGEPPEIKEPTLDGSKLPPFDQLGQYFGLAGLAGIATDDGWYLEGFVLKK